MSVAVDVDISKYYEENEKAAKIEEFFVQEIEKHLQQIEDASKQIAEIAEAYGIDDYKGYLEDAISQ